MPATKAFNWAVKGYERLAGSSITEEAEGLLHEALNFVYPTLPKPKNALHVRRMGVATLAIATSEGDEWRNDFLNALEAQRHFEVHCLLKSHTTAGRLRKPYGTEIERITPEEARERAVHWREVKGEWCWPHFSPQEMACRGSRLLYVEPALMDRLEALRKMMGGRPIEVTSPYRTPQHNGVVPGSAPKSPHMLGQAADIPVKFFDPFELMSAVDNVGFSSCAQYAKPKKGRPRLHIDVRPDNPWRNPDGSAVVEEGAFEPGVDYGAGGDDEYVKEPPADKSLGGVVVASGTAGGGIIYKTINNLEGGIIAAVTDISETFTQLARAVGQEMLPIAAACVAIYSGYQYRRQIMARIMSAVGRSWSGS